MFLTRILPFLIIVLTVVSIGFFIAASGDFIHLYEIDQGKWDVVISSSFQGSLFWAIPLAAILVTALWLLSSLLVKKMVGRKFSEVLSEDALSYLPLILGLLIPLRYLPDIAAFSSGLFLLCSTLMGPLLFVAAALVIFIKYRLFRKKRGPQSEKGDILKPLTDKAFGLIIFAVVFVFYLIAVPFFVNNSVFGGDQPHYLIISHSIVEDGDIYIKDDHDSGIAEEFTELHIEPQFFERTTDGRIIPFHRIGLPLLAAIPYMLLGKLGALLLIGLFAALSSMNIFWLCCKLIKNRKASLWATIWVSFTAPAFLLSFLFFTENVSILITLIALNLIFRKDDREPPRLWWLIPFIIWTLPWMHAKDLVTAIALSLLLVFKLKGELLKLIIAGLLCIVFAFGIPLFNFYFYGSFSPVAEMGSDQGMAFSISNAIHGLGGILFDQEFGIVLYNPALFLALLGIIPLFFRNASATIWMIIIIGFSIGPSMLFRMWWGGGSPPARYAVAFFHLLALPLAALLEDKSWRKLRPIFYILLACGIVISGTLLINNHLLIDDRDGTSKLLTSVSAGHIDAAEWWPSWIFDFQRSWPLAGVMLIWLAATILICILLKRIWCSMLWARRTSIPVGVFAGALFFLISFLGYTMVAESMTPEEPNEYNPVSHALDKAFHQRFRSGDYQFININNRQLSFPSRRFSSELLFGKENLIADDKASRGRSKPFSRDGLEFKVEDSQPFWAGEYLVELGLRSESAEETISVSLSTESAGKNCEFQATTDFQSFSIPMSINFNADNLSVKLKAENSCRLLYIIFRPTSLVTKEQWEMAETTFNQPVWKLGELHISASLQGIYRPEGDGFWTRGDTDTKITFISESEPENLKIVLRSRPGVLISLGAREYSFSDNQREIPLNLAPEWRKTKNNQWFCEISTSTTGKFVPANYNKNSTDQRILGVQISLR